MPELPEVEVTRLQLAPALVGRRIARVLAGPPSYFFFSTPPDVLSAQLLGRRFTELQRHGKHLIATLDDGAHLLCHLGMTGQLCVVPDATPLAPHVHLRLSLSAARERGLELRFRDARKFGKVEWLPPLAPLARIQRMGPDALSITATQLRAALAAKKVSVKTALMDQSVLAGVGNIYADEALFLAGLDPRRAGRDLSAPEVDELRRALRRVLQQSIRRGGSTISDFLGADGQPGSYQRHHRVYGRSGAPCPQCGAPIARVVLAQRSTHYCPRCQR